MPNIFQVCNSIQHPRLIRIQYQITFNRPGIQSTPMLQCTHLNTQKVIIIKESIQTYISPRMETIWCGAPNGQNGYP